MSCLLEWPQTLTFSGFIECKYLDATLWCSHCKLWGHAVHWKNTFMVNTQYSDWPILEWNWAGRGWGEVSSFGCWEVPFACCEERRSFARFIKKVIEVVVHKLSSSCGQKATEPMGAILRGREPFLKSWFILEDRGYLPFHLQTTHFVSEVTRETAWIRPDQMHLNGLGYFVSQKTCRKKFSHIVSNLKDLGVRPNGRGGGGHYVTHNALKASKSPHTPSFVYTNFISLSRWNFSEDTLWCFWVSQGRNLVHSSMADQYSISEEKALKRKAKRVR